MYEDSIRFPHLHITLDHVPDGIDVFGIHIAFYGMIIACAILWTCWLSTREAKRLGYSEEAILDIVFWGAFAGILGARAYYVIFAWDRYKDNPLSILNLRQGGLAIYGGLMAAFIALIFLSKKKQIPLFAVLDIVVFGGICGQVMGRWGNFFNREAFGDYTDSLFAMQLPTVSVRQPEAITAEMTSHAIREGGLVLISVHPTFLYESLWNLAIVIGLWLYRRHKKADGELFFLYLALYGAGRFWIEALRTDQLQLWNTGIPVSRIVAALCVITGTAVVTYVRKRAKFY